MLEEPRSFSMEGDCQGGLHRGGDLQAVLEEQRVCGRQANEVGRTGKAGDQNCRIKDLLISYKAGAQLGICRTEAWQAGTHGQ